MSHAAIACDSWRASLASKRAKSRPRERPLERAGQRFIVTLKRQEAGLYLGQRIAVVRREDLATSHPFVSVNFSGRQFTQPDVVTQVKRLVKETGCSPRQLRLELTETMIMENADISREKLSQLSDLGVQLYIDDFGTGYSSLSYLHQLPTDAIKIDRSFISQVTGRPEIVGTILNLARILNLGVEADGIETVAQLNSLRELGCESGQGCYFPRPVTPEMASSFLGTALAS